MVNKQNYLIKPVAITNKIDIIYVKSITIEYIANAVPPKFWRTLSDAVIKRPIGLISFLISRITGNSRSSTFTSLYFPLIIKLIN